MGVFIVLSALTAVPAHAGKRYTDTRKRFSFELAPGWHFAPQPGDTRGATFRREQGRLFGLLTIRILSAQNRNTETFSRTWFGALSEEPGYRIIEEGESLLAGVPARYRQFVVDIDGDSTWAKMTIETIAVVEGRAYLLHGETVAEAFGSFSDDFLSMTQSFTLPHRNRLDRNLIGRWRMRVDPTTVLSVRPNGTFDLAGSTGRYRIEDDVLVTKPDGGKAERFHYRVRGDHLMLKLEAGEMQHDYERIIEKPTSLFGYWRAGERRLRLSPGGIVIFGRRNGRYRVGDGMLLFKFKGEKRKAFQFDLGADKAGVATLTLRGGEFGKRTLFVVDTAASTKKP